MKNLIFLLSFAFCANVISQNNFEWILKDSVDMSKTQIYSLTKQFIAKTWKSANDVIQNDDETGGVINVKGLTSPIVFTHAGATYSYTYSYLITFKMKDNRFMMELNNVKCHSTLGSSFDNKYYIEPDQCDSKNKKFETKCLQLMIDLKSQLQNIVDLYTKEIESSQSDW
jgi:hypothetical protein